MATMYVNAEKLKDMMAVRGSSSDGNDDRLEEQERPRRDQVISTVETGCLLRQSFSARWNEDDRKRCSNAPARLLDLGC